MNLSALSSRGVKERDPQGGITPRAIAASHVSSKWEGREREDGDGSWGMEEQVENVSLSTSGRIESWNSASKAGSPESNLSPNKFQPLDCGK